MERRRFLLQHGIELHKLMPQIRSFHLLLQLSPWTSVDEQLPGACKGCFFFDVFWRFSLLHKKTTKLGGGSSFDILFFCLTTSLSFA